MFIESVYKFQKCPKQSGTTNKKGSGKVYHVTTLS